MSCTVEKLYRLTGNIRGLAFFEMDVLYVNTTLDAAQEVVTLSAVCRGSFRRLATLQFAPSPLEQPTMREAAFSAGRDDDYGAGAAGALLHRGLQGAHGARSGSYLGRSPRLMPQFRTL